MRLTNKTLASLGHPYLTTKLMLESNNNWLMAFLPPFVEETDLMAISWFKNIIIHVFWKPLKWHNSHKKQLAKLNIFCSPDKNTQFVAVSDAADSIMKTILFATQWATHPNDEFKALEQIGLRRISIIWRDPLSKVADLNLQQQHVW